MKMKVQRSMRMAMMVAGMTVAGMTALSTVVSAAPARAMQAQVETIAMGGPQVKDELFAGTEKFAQGASDVTDVNLGPDMLGMVSGKHGGDLAHKMNFMVVRSYTYPRAGMYRMEDVDAYRERLRTGNWNCFIHVHESKSGESTDICSRPSPDKQGNEMVIMAVEPKELTFIHMSGNGSLADLGKLGALGDLGGLGALAGHMPTPPVPPTPTAPPTPPSPRTPAGPQAVPAPQPAPQ